MATPEPTEQSTSLLRKLEGWGASSLPSMGLATLIVPLHFRPLQKLPMLFPPVLLGASYLNLAGYAIDSAGITAAWSGLYVLLSLRRRRLVAFRKGINARTLVQGAAMGLGTVNCLAGAVTYLNGDRVKEAAERKARNRWGEQ